MTGLLSEVFEVVAHNFAADSDNKIHDDEVAATFGFRGGLVPGVGVLGYMSRPVVDLWGRSWLEQGALSAKFLKPVYDGDAVLATATPAALPRDTSGDMHEGTAEVTGLTLELRDSSGQLCAVGEAGKALPGAAPLEEAFPEGRMPASRLAPDSRAIPVGDPVGSLQLDELARASLETAADRYRDNHPLYAGASAVLHPAFLPDQANTVLSSNVELGPWIHTRSTIQVYEVLVPDEGMQLRGRYAAAYSKRGHEIVELDLGLIVGGRVAATIHHTAIVRPRAGAGA